MNEEIKFFSIRQVIYSLILLVLCPLIIYYTNSGIIKILLGFIFVLAIIQLLMVYQKVIFLKEQIQVERFFGLLRYHFEVSELKIMRVEAQTSIIIGQENRKSIRITGTREQCLFFIELSQKKYNLIPEK